MSKELTKSTKNSTDPVKDISQSSTLKKIRERLKERQDVHVSGEIPVLVQSDTGSNLLLERIEFYIAPSAPSYDDEFLTDFTASLFPDIKPEYLSEEKFKKYEYPKYGRPYWSLWFANLRFKENIGLLKILKKASQYISYDNESLRRWNLVITIKGEVEEKPVKRSILIKILPEGELSNILYEYNRFLHNPERGDPILRGLGIDRLSRDNLSRSFEKLSSNMDIFDYEALREGHLRRNLEKLLERYSGAKPAS